MKHTLKLAAALLLVPLAALHAAEPFRLWTGDTPVPAAERIPLLPQDKVNLIWLENKEPFAIGHAIVAHKGVLYVNWAANPGIENTATEYVVGTRSKDGGKTWSGREIVAPPLKGEWRHSHGCYLSHGGVLRFFAAHFGGRGPNGQQRKDCAGRMFVLNEANGRWEDKGTVIPKGWPHDNPMKMAGGDWIMPLEMDAPNWPPAVAVSKGDDFTKWTVHPVAMKGLDMETCLLERADGSVLAMARSGMGRGWLRASTSSDAGKTWKYHGDTNIPHQGSKPTAMRLSNGRPVLVINVPGNVLEKGKKLHRNHLAVFWGEPGKDTFSHVRRIRPSKPLSRNGRGYPTVAEHDGRVYVAYYVNKQNGEVASFPLGLLSSDASLDADRAIGKP